jgi:tetratricopeptide (TPR) repeat protein
MVDMSAGKLHAVIVAVAFVLAHPGFSLAEKAASCVAQPIRSNMDACTAIIDNPYRDSGERADAFASRGLAFAILGKYPESVSDFDKALELIPDYAVVLNNRAWTYFKWRGSAEGMADVERALALEPGLDFFWDTRAHLRQVEGNFSGAFDDYEVAVGLGGAESVKTYQCGLKKRGLYDGELNGVYDAATREALKTCSYSQTCDPLPDNADFVVEQKPCDETIS